MAETGSSLVYSLLFAVMLSLQEVHRGKLESSEIFTILGGFTSSLLFLVLLTFIGNFQESCWMNTGWGAVILPEIEAIIAAGTVHQSVSQLGNDTLASSVYNSYPCFFTSYWLCNATTTVRRKAALCVHPDKVQRKGASCGDVFDILQEAWKKFEADELR